MLTSYYVEIALVALFAFYMLDYICRFLSEHSVDRGGSSEPCEIGFGRALNWCLIGFIFVLILGGWLLAERDSQLAPHHVTRYLGEKELADFWTTNNLWVSYREDWEVGSNGVIYYQSPVTNYYWHVWSIFQK